MVNDFKQKTQKKKEREEEEVMRICGLSVESQREPIEMVTCLDKNKGKSKENYVNK